MKITKDYLDQLRFQGEKEKADKLHNEYLENLMLQRIENKKKVDSENKSEERQWKKKYGLCIEIGCLNIARKNQSRCEEHKEKQLNWVKNKRKSKNK